MSERALEFVESWLSNHMDDELPGPADTQAAVLARQCLRDASANGIPELEVHEQFDDLTAFIAAQIAEAKERQGTYPDEGAVLAEEVIAEEVAEEQDDAEADKNAANIGAGPKA